MKLKLSKKILLDWKSLLGKFDTKSYCEIEKEAPFIFKTIHIRLILGMQPDVAKKQKEE